MFKNGPLLNILFINSFNFLFAFLFVYLWVLFRCCFFFHDAHLSNWLILMNCFCGMVKRRKPLSLVSNWDHCQRSSPSRISDTMRLGLEPVQSLSSGFVEWSCAVVITNMALTFDNLYRCLRVTRPSITLKGLGWKVITETYLALLISAGLMSVQGDP